MTEALSTTAVLLVTKHASGVWQLALSVIGASIATALHCVSVFWTSWRRFLIPLTIRLSCPMYCGLNLSVPARNSRLPSATPRARRRSLSVMSFIHVQQP